MKKSTENTSTEKVCKVCGKSHPIENFRVHKSGYILNKCKDCEKESWTSRLNSKKSFFTVRTKTGSYNVSTSPISGGRKVTSSATEKVLFVPAGVTRDQARSIFQVYTSVPRTGIFVSLV
jgi:hypothetical protein